MCMCAYSVTSVMFDCDTMDYCPQVPLSVGFSRQEYWSGVPFPSPGNLPNPWIKPVSPVLQVDSLPLSNLGSPICRR